MLIYFAMAVTSVRGKSTTFDELSHLTAGYSYWITGDFRLNPESGTLAQQWQALPLVFGGYRFPSLDQEAWWKADVFAVGYHFFYDQGNDVGAMLRAGRTMTAVLGVGLGLLVYAWSRRLFGPTGGVLTAALYRFRYAAIRIPSPEADPFDWAGVLSAAGAIGPVIAFARDHRLLPEAFLYGFARFLRLSLNRPAFLNGQLSWVGWRWFFPYCL